MRSLLPNDKEEMIHVLLAVLWALLLIPTLLWWKESILWVASMSLYANFVGHLSAYEAAKASGLDASDRKLLLDIKKKLDSLEK